MNRVSDPDVTPGQLLEVAEEHRRAGHLGDARSWFLDAASAAEAAGDRAALVAAALGAGGLWVHEQRDVVDRARLTALWDRALETVYPGSLEAALLPVRMAAEAIYAEAPGAGVDQVVTAVEAVRPHGDDRAVAESLSLLHHVLLGPEYAARRLAVAEELIAVAARTTDGLLPVMGLCWRTVDLFLLGDARARQSLAEFRERSAGAGCEALSFVSDLLDAMLLARAGRLQEAETSSAAAFELGAAVGDPDAPAYYGAMLAALRWWEGRSLEMIDAVRGLADSPRLGLNGHVYVAADALLSASTDDGDAAEEALARLNGIGLAQIPHSSIWLATQLLTCQAAYLLGDAETAQAAAAQLQPFADLPVMPSLAVVCLGSAEYGIGLASVLAGDLDGAAAHLESALRANRRLGNRPMATITEHVLAGVLERRGGGGDRERAAFLRERSQARASSMGLTLPSAPAWARPERVVRARARLAVIGQLPDCRWSIEVDGRRSIVGHLVGMSYLARLLERPGDDLDVFFLVGDGGLPRDGADSVLDSEAISQYRHRAKEIEEILASRTLPETESARYRRELLRLNEGLRLATRPGGVSRSFVDDHERARTAVRKALVRAIGLVESAEPQLGAHLRQFIGTGATCRYTPSPPWTVRFTRASDEQGVGGP